MSRSLRPNEVTVELAASRWNVSQYAAKRKLDRLHEKGVMTKDICRVIKSNGQTCRVAVYSIVGVEDAKPVDKPARRNTRRR